MMKDKLLRSLLIDYFTLRESDYMNDLYKSMEIEKQIKLIIKSSVKR